MQRILFVLFVALLALSYAAWSQVDLDDAALLEVLDEARFFDTEVSIVRVQIVSTTPEEEREAEIRLLFSEIEGETVSRIEFLAPEELAGQIYLNIPDGAFFFGPDLDFPIKTSASTEVFGDSAVAQTSGIRFLEDYTVSERRTTQAEEGTELLEVDLEAVDFSVAFQAVTVTVDPIAVRPVSAILYALSGLPFYEVFYETYETRGDDDVYAVRQRIVNLFLVGRQTVSTILEISDESLDQTLFDPNQLTRETES